MTKKIEKFTHILALYNIIAKITHAIAKIFTNLNA